MNEITDKSNDDRPKELIILFIMVGIFAGLLGIASWCVLFHNPEIHLLGFINDKSLGYSGMIGGAFGIIFGYISAWLIKHNFPENIGTLWLARCGYLFGYAAFWPFWKMIVGSILIEMMNFK